MARWQGERYQGKINGYAVSLEPGAGDLKVELTLPWEAVDSVRARRGCALIQAGDIHILFDSEEASEIVAQIHQLVPDLATRTATAPAAEEPAAAPDASGGWRRRRNR